GRRAGRRGPARRRAGSADAGPLGPGDHRCAGPGWRGHPDRRGGLALPARGGRVPHHRRARRAGSDNAITLAQAPDARAAADAISDAFARDAVLAVDVLSVETPPAGW